MKIYINLIEEDTIHTKVYAAYHKAVNSKGAPTVILALTTKGYGVGSREADNTTHQG
jgi:pyruvate dehydrogenase E1 component